MTYSLVLSLLVALIGVVLWIEGGPHPRTWEAWLLLGGVLGASALPTVVWVRSFLVGLEVRVLSSA